MSDIKETHSKKFGTGVTLGAATLVAFIAVWEGGKLKDGSSIVYADKLANNIPTVCGGLTPQITDTPIVVGERWSKEKCFAEEQKALIKVQTELEKCFNVMPPQSVFDAATSHAWNVGSPATCRSLAMKAWNDENWELGCNRISHADSGRRVWSFVTRPDGSKLFVKGLANRRDAERELCLSGLAPKEETVIHTPAPQVEAEVPKPESIIVDTPETTDVSPPAKTGGLAILGGILGGLVTAFALRLKPKK